MREFVNNLVGFEVPGWEYFVALCVLVGLGFFGYWFIRTRIFKFRLRRIVWAKSEQQIQEAVRKFSKYYSAEKLVRHSRRMERYSRQMGPRVVRETGLADKWTQKLTQSSLLQVADIRRVLLYCPSSSFFKAFAAAGQYPHLRKFFTNWMLKEGEEKVIRLLAESCRGEDFDPSFVKNYLINHGALLGELTGEPEWYSRYFAYKVLLLDKETLAERSLEAGLMDPHPLIRKIITESFSAEREKTWLMLWEKLVKDPVYEVREAARKRIAKDFMDLYNLKDKPLNADETYRILELLDPDSHEDRTFAMSILQSDSKELRFPAAMFLEKCGILSSFLAKNTLDDQANIEYSVRLLKEALEVNVSGFLFDYQTGDGSPLLVVARLLNSPYGAHESICYLVKKVFAFFNSRKLEAANREIYTETLEAIKTKENVRAFELLAEELRQRENDVLFLELLLPRLPVKAEAIFSPLLFRFLENKDFPAREQLINILGKFKPDIVLPEVFRILNGSRAEFSHEIRISALKILGLLRLPFCLQRILESLPTLRPGETEEFAHLIKEYPQDIFEEKTRVLLASPDARIRASLISILPATGNDSFIKEIRASLKDVDPDVRVAAIKALLGFGEIKLLNQETSMLRDPVERVRVVTAEVIGQYSNAAAMDILKEMVKDDTETDVVKNSIIKGLGQATNSAEGITLLVYVLDSVEGFREQAAKALANRVTKRDIMQLIDIFKDAEPQLREKLIPVFKAQGKKAEPGILEILKDEVASFKPYLVKILEETGYVDEVKRQLSHRSVETRREAANMLSLLDTLPAFRGLVMAAKDPDQEVRVCVVKALEKLKSDHGRDVLEKLKEDPDSRIRKYTHWALERLDSLKME